MPFVRGIAIDFDGDKMYWTDRSADMIRRANLDGSNVEDLVNIGFGHDPEGIAIDVASGKIYWTESDVEDKIRRSNLNGTAVEDLITTGLSGPNGIALDAAAEKMYWTDRNARKIQRANLDGSNVEDLLTELELGGGSTPLDIELDLIARKMFFSDDKMIRQANLDGSNLETLISGPTAGGLALDVINQHVYYSIFEQGVIRAITYERVGVPFSVSGLVRPWDIELDFMVVPEPTAFVLATLCFVHLLTYRWRPQQNSEKSIC